MSDAEARAILVGEWPDQPLASYQIVQAIGRFEGRYGDAFEQANNWGASQPTTAEQHGGTCPAGTTPALDHRADGTPYTACIERFATPELGARSLVRALTIRRPRVAVAMRTGNASAVAHAMHERPAYMAAPPARYARAILRNARAIATHLGEPLKVFTSDAGGGVVEVVVLACIAAFVGARLRRSRAA